MTIKIKQKVLLCSKCAKRYKVKDVSSTFERVGELRKTKLDIVKWTCPQGHEIMSLFRD